MNEDYLEHHGVLGQRWGIRRYQNPDGTLTEKGRRRLQRMDEKLNRYKDNETIRSEKKWNQRMNRLEKKARKYYTKGNDAKYTDAQREHMISQALKELENQSIKSLTYDEMKKEKMEIGKREAASWLSAAGSVAATTVLKFPVGFVYIPNRSNVKTNMRVPSETQLNVRKSVYQLQ